MSLFESTFLTSTLMLGRILASSQASNELSTPSLIAVINDLCRVSKPRKCLFFSKNSEIDACFCLLAKSSAIPFQSASVPGSWPISPSCIILACRTVLELSPNFSKKMRLGFTLAGEYHENSSDSQAVISPVNALAATVNGLAR